MKPLISICIPTYNRAQYLKETIQSVLDQTYQNFELIIRNDHSADSTEEVVKKFKDSRIKYFKNKENIGYIKTMNMCTKEASGEWIMHLSDDDHMLPSMLEEMVQELDKIKKKDTIGFVVPQTITMDEKGQTVAIPSLQLDKEKSLLLNPREFIYNFTLYGEKIRGKYKFNTSFPSTLFNRKILIELGMSSPEVPVSHDILIESKICLLYDVLVIDKPLFKYRVHENLGSSLNRKGEFLQEYLNFLKLLFKFIKERKISFDYDFEKYCYDALLIYLFSVNGGLVRLAARYDGGYVKKVRVVSRYISYGVSKKKQLVVTPQFYLSAFASFLPRKVLIVVGKMMSQI